MLRRPNMDHKINSRWINIVEMSASMDVPRTIYVDISSLIKDIENKNVSYCKRIVRQHFYHKTFGQRWVHGRPCKLFPRLPELQVTFPSELRNCMYYGKTGLKNFDDMYKRLVTILALDRRELVKQYRELPAVRAYAR